MIPRVNRIIRERASRLGRRLRGLDKEPNPKCAERMVVFDALPYPVRAALGFGPFDYNAGLISRYLRDRGEAQTLRQIAASNDNGRREWAAERAAALIWAAKAISNQRNQA